MKWRATRKGGSSLAAIASAIVVVQHIFTIRFSTIVETEGQEKQHMIHGGNYVKTLLFFHSFVINKQNKSF